MHGTPEWHDGRHASAERSLADLACAERVLANRVGADAEQDRTRHFGPPAALRPVVHLVRLARPAAPSWVAGRLRLTDRSLEFRPGSAAVDAGDDLVLGLRGGVCGEYVHVELVLLCDLGDGRGHLGGVRAGDPDGVGMTTVRMRCLGAPAVAALIRSVARLA